MVEGGVEETMKKRRGATLINEEEVKWLLATELHNILPLPQRGFIPCPGLPCVCVCACLCVCVCTYQTSVNFYLSVMPKKAERYIQKQTSNLTQTQRKDYWIQINPLLTVWQSSRTHTHTHTHIPNSGLELKNIVVNSPRLIFTCYVLLY